MDTAMQAEIRAQPPGRLIKEVAETFQGLYNRGELLSPIEIGKKVAALAGEAGEKFRGQFIDIEDAEIQAFLQENKTKLATINR